MVGASACVIDLCLVSECLPYFTFEIMIPSQACSSLPMDSDVFDDSLCKYEQFSRVIFAFH